MKLKRLGIDLSPSEHTRLKLLAVKQNTSMADIARAAINREVKHARQPRREVRS